MVQDYVFQVKKSVFGFDKKTLRVLNCTSPWPRNLQTMTGFPKE